MALVGLPQMAEHVRQKNRLRRYFRTTQTNERNMMEQYPKIQTVYKRDPDNNFKTLLEGEYSLPELWYLKDCAWEWTEKVDGTNIRVDWDGEDVRFAGRTDKAQTPQFLLDKLEALFPSTLFESTYPDVPMTLYGEGYGARVQKGGGNYIPDGVDFVLFDVLVEGKWLSRQDIITISVALDCVEIVPIIGSGSLGRMVDFVRDGFDSYFGDDIFQAEGIVARPQTELCNRHGQRIITKIKAKDFPKGT